MAHVRKVSIPENVYRILLSRQSHVNDLFIRRFQCTAEVTGPSTAAGSASLKVYEKRHLGGTLISVWRDDLTRQDADVVVNAANEKLGHWGGLALALVKAGGQQIVQESKDWISKKGTLRAGDIAVTTAGTLPSKQIVHAVGPQWSAAISERCVAQLTEAISKVLDYVCGQRDLHSVAIPAVSSGIFGFPLDFCAEIIVKTVDTFCSTKGKGHLKEVRLVNYDDKTVQAMKIACEKQLGNSDMPSGAASSYPAAASSSYPTAASSSYPTAASSSYPTAASSSYPTAASSSYPTAASSSYPTAASSSYPTAASSSYPTAASSSYPTAASSSYPTAASSAYPAAASSSYPTAAYPSYSAAASSSYPTAASSAYPAAASSSYSAQPKHFHHEVSLSVNGLNLHLKTGCIEDEKTEVIVNSVASSLNLDYGVISKAIYSKGGWQMQEEIWKKSQWNAAMIPTRGYNLPCKYVYHVKLQGARVNELQSLREVTKECLKTAHQHRSPSISFPALGTGNIGLPKDTVADIMTQCVLDFARQNQRKMDVYFVIHPKDADTLKAFQDKFRKTDLMRDNKMAEPTERWRASEPPGEGTYVTISGERRDDVDEAAVWLQGVLSSTPMFIHNNLLLLFGVEEFDSLASGSSIADITEDLSNGRVTLQISGPQPDKVMAAVQAERLLLDVQEKVAESLEEELLEAAVIWFYESPSGSKKYSAKATRELEKAFASGTNVTLSATPGHVIDIKNFTAQEGGQRLSIRRQCLRGSNQTEKRPPQTNRVKSDKDWSTEFRTAGLMIVTMEKVQNKLLDGVFQTKKEAAEKRQKKPSTAQMYQLVPRRFLKDIRAAGFHRLYVTPTETKYGVGVYFKKSLHNITQRFQVPKEKDGLLYIVQAEVVTGAATNYSRTQPVLPCGGPDALQVYESVTDGGFSAEHYSIFDRFQANPQYVFTCRTK
ncbi:protein mono-ADP-ribosyltransferase PARP9 [Hyla sarda]|uniref:protein mono-ADP-ribosyltransferase PARP9 n=1 Tax=Hyla sarda TaxID=327740 RepID=UPI0024C33EAD|nr:protein mono-ADP-ribosyltransferase PARP9 [Hyla sarda]XP_056390982.1 protein mono-ADP-ribosyltransferase PARP9 [Hyla sarda]